jgi:hypothetical protein
MPKRTTSPAVFEQTIDEAGIIVLDRRLTPEEAQAQDAEHRARYEKNRRTRFAGPTPDVIARSFGAPAHARRGGTS